jgi:hypothetical protein
MNQALAQFKTHVGAVADQAQESVREHRHELLALMMVLPKATPENAIRAFISDPGMADLLFDCITVAFTRAVVEPAGEENPT